MFDSHVPNRSNSHIMLCYFLYQQKLKMLLSLSIPTKIENAIIVIQLDKSGQSRLASGAFHEAATLFQCFLDLPESFRHVTNLEEDDCQAVLAYALVRLGFLNCEALSDANAAIRLYK